MPLKDLQLKYEYRSDTTNIVDDFYVPCLTESTGYWRAVGYFTSHGITLAAKGLSAFIAHEGHMRLVASPILDKDDIEAFEKGYSARESIIERAILHDIDFETVNDAPELVRHRLACLAWLIAENRLDIKIAVPLHTVSRSIPGIYHEKVGIFFDSKGDVVAFTGSPNETVGGLVSNFESFDVFMSWDDQHERTRRKIDNFENLWNNATQGIAVLDFPEAAKQQILRFRPSSKPSNDPEANVNLLIPTLIKSRPPREIGIPENIDLRYYQREASEAWLKNDGRGFLSMATGSGKTITALASVIRLYQDNGKIFVVVVCPFQHLVDQWNDESMAFGFQPILAYQSRNSWESKLNTHIVDYNLDNRNIVFVITTHSTFISDTMQQSLSRIKGLSVIVADEVHHLGAEESRENLPEGFTYRMGLSATPERWFDEEGTDSLKQYFGDTIYEFPLKDAIREGCLCEYN